MGVPPSFELSEQQVDGRVVISPRGEIDLATVGELNAAVERALGAGAADLWIDLTAVEFMDSTGLTALVRAYRALDHGSRRLAVICPAGPARRALEVSGLDTRIPIFPDCAAAAAEA